MQFQLNRSCTACDQEKTGTFWNCRNYYGITGSFCTDCYDMISHDPYGKPSNPEGLSFLVLKLGLKVNYE